MHPDDIALLRTPGIPTVSPDGRMAVVAVSRPDLEADDHRSQLWAVPTDGSAPARALTSGAVDTDPAFSPDGRWLAYLAAEPGQQPQLHLLPTAGGAPRRLTDHPLGAGAPVWAPDSRRLAYTARVPEPGRHGTDPGVAHGAEPPRLITTLRWQLDGVGVLADRRSRVFVLDLPPDGEDDGTPLPQPRQVTDGPARDTADDTDVTWSPDGTELAFVSARHPRADRDLVRDVYAIPAAGGTLRRVTDGRADCALPAYDPSGAWIYLTARPDLGPDGLDVAARSATLCRVPAAGGRWSRCSTPSGPTAATRLRRPCWPGERRTWASSAAARWSCSGCRWTAGRLRSWSTGRSPCAGSPRVAASSSPRWRTTGPPGS